MKKTSVASEHNPSSNYTATTAQVGTVSVKSRFVEDGVALISAVV